MNKTAPPPLSRVSAVAIIAGIATALLAFGAVAVVYRRSGEINWVIIAAGVVMVVRTAFIAQRRKRRQM